MRPGDGGDGGDGSDGGGGESPEKLRSRLGRAALFPAQDLQV